MRRAPPAALPDIDGEACVHALAPRAGCHACVAACPAGALVLGEESLGIDESRCTSCALCVPACPRGAVHLDRPVEVIAGRPHPQAFAACAVAGRDAPGPACLHALGVRDLDALAEAGVTQLSVTAATCEDCATRADPSALPRAAEAHRMVRVSHGLTPVAMAWLSGPAFARARARAREDEAAVDQVRRRLFRPLLAAAPVPAPQAAPRAYVTPVIDPALCTGCDACARICPDGALRLERQGAPRYAIAPEHCSGCGLCCDVCDSNAVRLDPLGSGISSVVPLSAFRCRACGVSTHRPASVGIASADLCRICAVTGHHSKLFQVFDAS